MIIRVILLYAPLQNESCGNIKNDFCCPVIDSQIKSFIVSSKTVAMVLNNTAITTTGGAVASYTALALDVAAVLLVAGAIVSSAGRKKRNAAAAALTGAEERFLQEAVYKVCFYPFRQFFFIYLFIY